MASPTIAANAYANLARLMDPSAAGKSPESSGPSFGDLLKNAISDVVDVACAGTPNPSAAIETEREHPKTPSPGFCLGGKIDGTARDLLCQVIFAD